MILLDAQVELQDIVVAPAASWWPIAFGWYIAGIAALIIIVTLSWALRRAIRRRRVRRLALRHLHQHTPQSLAEVSLLLKQAALAYYPATWVNTHTPTQWWAFLMAPLSARQRQRYQPLATAISELSYQPLVQQQTWLTPYSEFAEFWLRQALPPSARQRKAVREVAGD